MPPGTSRDSSSENLLAFKLDAVAAILVAPKKAQNGE
jgi:hypothetical protein